MSEITADPRCFEGRATRSGTQTARQPRRRRPSSSWWSPRRRRSASSAASSRSGIASGNGAGFPATFVVSTVILLFFAVGFTALTPYVEEAGAFFSYVRTALGFPAGIGIAFVALVSYVAIEAGVYGLLGPAGGDVVELFGGPALPWWVFAAVAFAVTTFLGYRNIELSSRVLAVLLTAEIAIVVVLDLVIVVRRAATTGCRPASSTRARSSPARWASGCCSR